MSYTICSRFKGEHIVYAGYTICTSREHIVYGAFCGSTVQILLLSKYKNFPNSHGGLQTYPMYRHTESMQLTYESRHEMSNNLTF